MEELGLEKKRGADQDGGESKRNTPDVAKYCKRCRKSQDFAKVGNHDAAVPPRFLLAVAPKVSHLSVQRVQNIQP
jgi:hypothetical protein